MILTTLEGFLFSRLHQLAKELYERNSFIQIVFLSGYKDFEYAQQAIGFGVKNYITKPTKYGELSTIFSKIKSQLDQQKVTAQEQSLPVSDKVIEIIINYVNNHYKDASLEGASQLVHMNPFYISKYFKEKTGKNFSDFVVNVKMGKAIELLDNVNYRIYEVSEMVGYSNPKNFTRTFRNYYGKTPREYRSKVRGIQID